MPAMRQVKVACVGTNGHQIVGLWDGLDSAKLTGLAEFDRDRLAALQRGHPRVLEGVPQFDSLAELLANCECELVSVCSARRDGQAEDILACLSAEKHVLAEKPLCTTLHDLRAIRDASARACRNVWAMLPMRYAPIFQEFERRVRAGEIGEVGQVLAQKSYKFGGNRPQDRGIDGGIIQAAVHAVSFVRSTTGLEFSAVAALDSAVGNDKTGNLQVEFAMTARLRNGALCQIVSNYLNPDTAPWWGNDQLRIFGTRGMLEVTDGLTRAALYLPTGAEHREIKPDHGSYLPDLIAQVASGKPAKLSPEDSFRCTRIAIEAQLSARDNGALRPLEWSE